MQTQLNLSKYEKRILLISLWSAKDLTQKERENNYDLATSLGMSVELYELSIRGRLKELVVIPEHLTTPPSEGTTPLQLKERQLQIRALEESVAEAVQTMDQDIGVVNLDTWHLKHIVAMLDKVQPEGSNGYFLARIGFKIRNLLLPTTA
jgi:hypothetical protein